MGCDIHPMAQKLVDGKYVDLSFMPFDRRSYGMFGFLADVRNYSHIPPISAPRGYPDDDLRKIELEEKRSHPYAELDGAFDYHSASWLTVAELVDFDYDKTFEDRRCTAKHPVHGYWDGASDSGEGNGKVVTYREFLGTAFFEDLAMLQQLGADRVVFDFDS